MINQIGSSPPACAAPQSQCSNQDDILRLIAYTL